MSMLVDYFFNDFVHQVIGNIYRMFLEHITVNLTTRFNTKIMATYHKAIEVLRDETPEPNRAPRLPAICVDPTLPLNMEEKSKQLWRVPVATIFSRRLFEPIYQDENIRITPGFVRYESPVSVYMWFDSIYELIDTEVRFLQAFHGTERWSKPFGMEVFCPLPNRVYTYNNPDGIIINWPEKYIPRLLDTIDQEIPMFPMYISPMVKLNSFSDMSTRDKDSGMELGTCRLQADFTFEFEVPTFFLVETFWQIRNLQCTIHLNDIPTNMILVKETMFIDDPNEPTDPDNGIIVPKHVIPEEETNFNFEEIKRIILYTLDSDTKLLPTDLDYNNLLVFSKGIIAPVESYNINEEENTIYFNFEYFNEGDTVFVIFW